MKTSDRELLKGYYWNHDALRMDVARVETIIKKFSAYSVDDWKKLSAWYQYHEFCLHNHHHGEDTYFFPIMKSRTPEFKTLIDGLEHEHVELGKLIGKMHAHFSNLANGEKISSTDFETTARSYNELILSHLAKEEKVVEDCIGKLLVEDVRKVEEDYRKTMPRAQMSKLLPWMVGAMDDKDREFFFGMVPFFVKWIYNWSAKPKYEKMLGAI